MARACPSASASRHCAWTGSRLAGRAKSARHRQPPWRLFVSGVTIGVSWSSPMGKRVTLELDSESIAAAQEAGIDLSQLLVEALRQLHAAEREAAARKWYEENKEAVEAHNQF